MIDINIDLLIFISKDHHSSVIDEQYRYESKLFVFTDNRSKNAAVLNKINVAKKIVGKINHDLFIFCYRGGLFHYERNGFLFVVII